MFCEHCGSKLNEDAKVCIKCGCKVSSIIKSKKESKSGRDWLTNAAFFILSAICFVLVPVIISLMFFFTASNVVSLLSNIVYICIVFLIYREDLVNEGRRFKEHFKEHIKTGLKYYIAGILAMMFFNIVISLVIKDVSANESAVRELLFSSPIITMISISIMAPLSEEFLFRKSLSTLTKNKWVFAIISGLLFGGAHLIAGDFQLINLLYLLPYGSLGIVFALMDAETKSTWTSVTMHAIHNTITGIMLLALYFLGAAV